MRKIIAALAVVVVALAGLAQTASAGYEQPDKVFVCKYVGTPGVNETLQTGQNPISVSVNAIPDFPGIGGFFADQQGRSLVIAFDTGQDEPSCPDGQGCEEDCTPPPTDVCTNIEGVQESVPEGLVASEDENGRPTCVEPETPPTDVCTNLQGVQSVVPPGYMLVGGNCVPVIPPPPHTCTFIGADKDGGHDLFGGTNDDCAPRPIDPKTTTTTGTVTTTIVYVDRIVTPPIREITKTVKVKGKTKVVVKYRIKIVVKHKIKKVYIEKKHKCPPFTKLYKGVCVVPGKG